MKKWTSDLAALSTMVAAPTPPPTSSIKSSRLISITSMLVLHPTKWTPRSIIVCLNSGSMVTFLSLIICLNIQRPIPPRPGKVLLPLSKANSHYFSLWQSSFRYRCGFTARNFEIQHSELWDSVVPLLHLTRNGGPLFKTDYSRAISLVKIRFVVVSKS